MPIKFPKGFNRRKSSINALEEVQNPPEPSFRVFERPQAGSKSFDGGNTLKRTSQSRPVSAGQYLESHREVNGRPGPKPSPVNRGSGGTNHSSSSGGLYDTSSSSARFSSSSTLPSSSSIEAIPDDYSHSHPKTPYNIPIPPTPASQPAFSVRAAGRTFSFGRKVAQPSPPVVPTSRPESPEAESPSQAQASSNLTRRRALTESSYASASTATPPKLLDTDFDFGKSDDPDGFGNMFEGFGNRKSRILSGQSTLDGIETVGSEYSSPAGFAKTADPHSSKRLPFTPPPPINSDRLQDVVSSPFSCESHDSRDGLISSSSPAEEQRRFEYQESPPVPRHYHGVASSKYMPVEDTNSPTSHTGFGPAIRRSSAYAPRSASTPRQNDDAMLATGSVNTNQRLNRRPVGFGSSSAQSSDRDRQGEDVVRPGTTHVKSSDYSPLGTRPSFSKADSQAQTSQDRRHSPVGLFDGDDSDLSASRAWQLEAMDNTPRPKKTGLANYNEPVLDQHVQSAAPHPMRDEEKNAERYSNRSPTRHAPHGKVMTPAQFEQYRKEQELSRTRSNGSKSKASDDGSDTYDDDDETERNRQLANQRRKQQADLAVYRQQMMKVTGEQPSNLPTLGQARPGPERLDGNLQNLPSRLPPAGLGFNKPIANVKSSDDEDEDIPLGILAAHGFPTKNRPPAHLAKTGSTPSIRYTSETYPPPPASVAGESTTSRTRGALPPFARNLPPDPYYGASLVNPSNRESLAFGNTNRASVYGGPPPNLHPGGLVGVIAGEERARAIRRGSPNGQGNYSDPYLSVNGMQPMPPNMGQMGMPTGMPPFPVMASGDQAQFEMSQQMTQMMQMQMQWMQQMMSMQGMQSGQQTQMPFPQQPTIMNNNGFLAPPRPPMHRPMSMGSNSVPVAPGVPPHFQHRSMSMLDNTAGTQLTQRGNRVSMAPSMMSGALGPSQGYAPSIAPSERSNVGMPSRYRPVSIAPIEEAPKGSRASSLSPSTALQGFSAKQGGAQAKKTGGNAGGSDDDDEEGWEEMKKKREKKKSTWRLRKKDEHGLGDVYYPGT